MAHKYLVDPPPNAKKAVAVLGEQKDWVEKEGWAVLNMNIDEEAMKIPEDPALLPKVEL